MTRPVQDQFWITVPVVGTAPSLSGDRSGGLCSVTDLWSGYPAPDGTRIASAIARVGDERRVQYLMMLFDVEDRSPEHRLGGDLLRTHLRQTLELVSAATNEPGPVL